jgi:hypothetical protein
MPIETLGYPYSTIFFKNHAPPLTICSYVMTEGLLIQTSFYGYKRNNGNRRFFHAYLGLDVCLCNLRISHFARVE